MVKNKLKIIASKNNSEMKKIRLNKFIANSGICSRREADKFIQAGVIKVNNIPVTELGLKINYSDNVKFNNQEVKADKLTYILLNKARTSFSKQQYNMKDIIKSMCKETIYPTDNLGKKESGLILFTNDRELIQKEKSKFKAIYHIILNRKMKNSDLNKIKEDKIFTKKNGQKNSIKYIENHEKNEIGVELNLKDIKILTSIIRNLGYAIKTIDRVTLANLTKKDLPRRAYRNLMISEINMLKRL